MRPTEPTLLDGGSVIEWLLRSGLLAPGNQVRIEPLEGGVSSLVLAISTGTARWVLKQSLPRLAVAEEWLADPVRLQHEAAGLTLARSVTPDRVPRLMHADLDRGVLLLERAPVSWIDWRHQLLAGEVEPRIGQLLGHTLARWHAVRVSADRHFTESLAHAARCFRDLRLDPFHSTVVRRLPELAARIDAVTAELVDVPEAQRAFVHGDFSPKNVLVDAAGTACWVIDFEVTHLGDPIFDASFLACHLMLKRAHLPQCTEALRVTFTGFAESYETTVPFRVDWGRVARHTGVLLLARVHGKSPAAYLDTATRDQVDATGRLLLDAADVASAAELWQLPRRILS